jgi:hypothetical protein
MTVTNVPELLGLRPLLHAGALMIGYSHNTGCHLALMTTFNGGSAMKSSQQSENRTRMFARVIGPYLAIMAATVALRPTDMRSLLSGFEADPLWSWITGAFILLFGLMVIALHPYWRGAAAIIVSAVGWLAAAKGLFLVAFPHTYLSMANSAVDAMGWWRAGAAVEVLIGLYLAYVGWIPARTRPASQPASSTPDLPRAA